MNTEAVIWITMLVLLVALLVVGWAVCRMIVVVWKSTGKADPLGDLEKDEHVEKDHKHE